MIVYVILVILALFFTWMRQVGTFKNGMKISFFFVFLFLALRYDYGNDFSSYYNEFLSLRSLQDEDFYFKENEVGWLYFNYFFKYFFGDNGFHVMLATMAAFTCFVLYRFTKKYLPVKYYTFAVALLLLEPNNILVLSSAMRQSVAVSIFLFSFDYLLRRKYLLYFAGILLASLFHTSVLFFISLVVLNFVNWRVYIPYVFLVFLGMLFLLTNLTFIFDQINLLLEYQSSEYLYYTNQGFKDNKYGLGFVLYVFLYLLVLILNRKAHASVEQNTIVKIALVALLLLILGLSVQLANRLNYYIFPLVVSSFAMTLENLRNYRSSSSTLIYRMSTLVIVLFFGYQNYMFWQSKVYSHFFIEYNTIIFK
jgi:transmembrane protein EpsG